MGGGGVNKAREELPWNADWVLVLTAECWVSVWMDTEEGRDCEGGKVDWACDWEERWKLAEGKVFTGPWTKSLNSSSSSEKPMLGAEDEGWAWEENPKLEGVVVKEEEDEEGGKGNDVGVSTGPWKSLKSSLSSDIAGGREGAVTDGCDGDVSAKMKK